VLFAMHAVCTDLVLTLDFAPPGLGAVAGLRLEVLRVTAVLILKGGNMCSILFLKKKKTSNNFDRLYQKK
jgi:hypothetical protein